MAGRCGVEKAQALDGVLLRSGMTGWGYWSRKT